MCSATITNLCDCAQQTNDGGYIIAGRQLSAGALLIKVDSLGRTEWYNTYASVRSILLAHEADEGYMVAEGYDSFLIYKTDSKGNKIWEPDQRLELNALIEHIYSVRPTRDGGHIWYGWMIPDEPVVSSSMNDFEKVLKTALDVSGQPAGRNESSTNVFGKVLKTDSFGNREWEKEFSGLGTGGFTSGQQTSDGGYILCGTTYPGNFGESVYGNIWLIKIDLNGNRVWERNLDFDPAGRAMSVQETDDGGFVIAASKNSDEKSDGSWINRDAFLIRTDANGNKLWDRTFGGLKEDTAELVQQTIDGGYIILGTTNSFGSGESDIWLIKTDAYGNI